jgi:hypothetical protein
MKHWLLVMVIWLAFLPLPSQAQDSLDPLPEAHRLDLTRLNHLYQGWNNCGPATLTMALGYYGFPDDDMADQEVAASYLKPNREDQNVSFWQLADYVNTQLDGELRALVRRGGDLATLKRLLNADLPVILGKGLEVPEEGWVGHFALTIGYDDDQAALLTYDSYQGHGNFEGLPQPYSEVETLWGQFNNVFMVIYPQEREAEVARLLGPLWEEEQAWLMARDSALQRLQADPADPWANFHLGEALTALGDYPNAAQAYEVALFGPRQLPWRILWYMQGAFRAYYEVGDYPRLEQAIRLVTRNTPYIEDTAYYRGLAAAAQGDITNAREYLEAVLEFNPHFYPAAQALADLER